MFFMAHPCCSRYVDTAGSDSNDGKTPATAWATVAKVNAATLTPYQQIGFKAGGTWPEELLIPSSGAQASNVSFMSYGAGAKPIITGADVVGGGGWTQNSVTALDTQTFASGGLSGTFWSNTACTFPTSPVQGSSTHSLQCSAGNAASLRAVPNSNVIETDAYFQLQSSTATSGQKTRVFFAEGTGWNNSNGVATWVTLSGAQYQLAVGRGSSITGSTFNISVGTWYLLRFLVSANSGNSTDSIKLYANGSLVSSLTGLSLTSAANGDINVGGQGAFNDVFTENFDSLSVYNQDSTVLPNTWFSTVSWQPFSIHFNETNWGGAPQLSASAVSSLYQWFWGSNTLTVYSVGNPNSTYTSPGVQAAHRAYAITRNGQSYFTVSNLTVEGSNQTGSVPGNIFVGRTGPGDGNTESSGVILSGLDSRYTGGECGWLDSIGGKWVNSTAEYCGGMAFDFDSGANMTAINLVAHDAQYGTYPGSYLEPSTVISNITLINFSCTGNIAQNCISLSWGTNYTLEGSAAYPGSCNLSGGTFNGLFFDGTTVTGSLVTGCAIHGNGDAGVYIGAGNETNTAIQFNQIYSNTVEGIHDQSGNASTTIYQNTLYANGTDLVLTGTSTGANVRNNIGNSAGSIEVNIATSASGSITMDYNDWLATGNFMSYHGTPTTFAGWKTASSLDTNSISANPLFVTPGSNFNLQGGSPAIGAGVFIAGVSTANPPNIGAK